MTARAALLLIALAATAARPVFAQTAVSALPPPPGILVVPFENPQHDPRSYWLGEAAAILLTEDLNARGINAIPRAARVQAFDQLHLPLAASISRATVIKVGQIVGASKVIVGDLEFEGDTLIVRATPIRLDVGRADADVTERGELHDLFGVFARLSKRLEPGGSASVEGERPPLEALEPYVKGLLAESPATQATFLGTALERYPQYDRARLALWQVRTEQGDHEAALAAARAVPATSPLSRRARFAAGVSLLELEQYQAAFDAFKALADQSPDAAVFNNLGVVQLRRGVVDRATGTPIYFFTKAAQADPDDPDYSFNLGYAYALDRDVQGALYWLRESLRRNPTDADAHVVLAVALEGAGSTVEATRERTLAGQLASKYTFRRADDPAPRGLERVRHSAETNRARRASQAIATTAQRDQRELATYHLDRARRLFEREQDREAMAELRRVIYLSPYEAEAHLLIGRIHVRAGRPHEAIDALKISIWSRDTAAAHVALAEARLATDDAAAARAEVARALELEPESAEAKKLRQRLDGGR
jgi:tetratricopeptide (TPR) repeat protein